jgi:hypothetical protein
MFLDGNCQGLGIGRLYITKRVLGKVREKLCVVAHLTSVVLAQVEYDVLHLIFLECLEERFCISVVPFLFKPKSKLFMLNS